MATILKKGQKAPSFALKGIDEEGAENDFSLKEFKGKYVLLYFYPRDNTPGCTTEACDFRDNFSRLKKDNTVVLGVSPDSIASHLKFKEKHALGFPLLSDPEKKVAESYGAYGEKNSTARHLWG